MPITGTGMKLKLWHYFPVSQRPLGDNAEIEYEPHKTAQVTTID